MSTKQKTCPSGKIYNSATRRCVNKDGVVGKAIKAGTISELYKKKDCPKKKIYNPASRRCVNETGVIGKELSKKEGKQKKPKPALKKKPKKLSKKKREPTLPPGFELLPDDMIREILLNLDGEDLKSACATSPKIAAICKGEFFQKQYKKLREFEMRERPGQPMVTKMDNTLDNAVITSVIEPGLIKISHIHPGIYPSYLAGTLDLKKLDKEAFVHKKDPLTPGYNHIQYDPKTKKCRIPASSYNETVYMIDKPLTSYSLTDYFC